MRIHSYFQGAFSGPIIPISGAFSQLFSAVSLDLASSWWPRIWGSFPGCRGLICLSLHLGNCDGVFSRCKMRCVHMQQNVEKWITVASHRFNHFSWHPCRGTDATLIIEDVVWNYVILAQSLQAVSIFCSSVSKHYCSSVCILCLRLVKHKSNTAQKEKANTLFVFSIYPHAIVYL